mgnify:CR=1 FL=1
MENTQLKILSEIKASLESLKSQIDILEAKVDAVAVLLPEPEEGEAVAAQDLPEPVAEPEPVSEPIDLDISDMVGAEPSVPGETPIDISVGDLPEDFPVDIPVEVHEPEPSETPAEEKKKVLELNDAEGLKEKHAVLDKLTEKQSWRTDMPGSPVSNIISAISLNDRVLFINTLFGEDPMKFRSTIDTLNAMGGLGEAIEYVLDEFPQWNLDSDVVYRFMMAVRRRLR